MAQSLYLCHLILEKSQIWFWRYYHARQTPQMCRADIEHTSDIGFDKLGGISNLSEMIGAKLHDSVAMVIGQLSSIIGNVPNHC